MRCFNFFFIFLNNCLTDYYRLIRLLSFDQITLGYALRDNPASASLASDNRRGAIIGSVMSGLLSSMLLSRILVGSIATNYGWGAMFLLGIPLVLAGAAAMALLLPLSQPSASMKYGPPLRSLLHLWREESSTSHPRDTGIDLCHVQCLLDDPRTTSQTASFPPRGRCCRTFWNHWDDGSARCSNSWTSS